MDLTGADHPVSTRPRRVTHVVPALVLLGCSGAIGILPGVLADATAGPPAPAPPGVVTVPLKSKGGAPAAAGQSSVTFTPPAGWAVVKDSPTSYTYTRARRTFGIKVVQGVALEGMANGMDRQLARLTAGGSPAAYDGGKVTTDKGITGRTCNMVRPPDYGECAIVGKGSVLVVVTSIAPPEETAEPLEGVIDSLEITIPEAPGQGEPS